MSGLFCDENYRVETRLTEHRYFIKYFWVIGEILPAVSHVTRLKFLVLKVCGDYLSESGKYMQNPLTRRKP